MRLGILGSVWTYLNSENARIKFPCCEPPTFPSRTAEAPVVVTLLVLAVLFNLALFLFVVNRVHARHGVRPPIPVLVEGVCVEQVRHHGIDFFRGHGDFPVGAAPHDLNTDGSM